VGFGVEVSEGIGVAVGVRVESGVGVIISGVGEAVAQDASCMAIKIIAKYVNGVFRFIMNYSRASASSAVGKNSEVSYLRVKGAGQCSAPTV